jgi:hypothetical protein
MSGSDSVQSARVKVSSFFLIVFLFFAAKVLHFREIHRIIPPKYAHSPFFTPPFLTFHFIFSFSLGTNPQNGGGGKLE